MKKSANQQLLSDNSVNGNEKLILSVYLKKDCILKADALNKLTGCQSRNDVIEKALDFYFAYVAGQMNQDYLCGVFGGKMEGLIGTLATRISKSNFRSAVEMEMLTRMVASVLQISQSQYDKMRVTAIRNVKQTNGSINIMEANNEADELFK